MMARVIKYLKFIVHITLLVLINYFIKNQKREKVLIKVLRYMPDMKHLLMWTKVPGVEVEGQRYFISKNCEFINCYLTSNRTLFEDLRYFDGIIFNVQDVSSQSTDLPKVRSLEQKYIFAANDSSGNYPVCDPVYDNYFNWTWTYKLNDSEEFILTTYYMLWGYTVANKYQLRRYLLNIQDILQFTPDSSIPYTFISVSNIHDEELGNNVRWNYKMKPITNQFKSILSSKSQAAAIYLDKCVTTSRREVFLKNLKKELAQYNLTVDVFGPCGTLKCGRRSLKPCYYRIKRTYYFYLALEDSIATDYITRLVLLGYENHAVPVVFGGAQYHRYLPPDSYLDGSTIGEEVLAKAMNDLIKNKEKYYDYFRWRNHYIIKESPILDPCSLCSSMNNENWLRTRISYVLFRKWWNPFYGDVCGSGIKNIVL